ncbi:MAG: hypothetical protein COA42_17230 [Alteromonadaceae bacterium]|nr:MAG: hypothetical protein COA42_17230 [Alteromonadaceae bacterium]
MVKISIFKIFGFLLLTQLVACGAEKKGDSYDIKKMGDECAELVSEIPVFSCLDGEVIPITKNGIRIDQGQHSINKNTRCDRPKRAHAGTEYGRCQPFSRVGRLASEDPDVKINFICRKFNIVDDQEDVMFNGVAVVAHNTRTGDTCFFRQNDNYDPDSNTITEDTHPRDATRVPPPSEPEDKTPPGKPTAKTFWKTPEKAAEQNCMACHDAGPFIHTPHVDQVTFGVSNERVVYPVNNCSGTGDIDCEPNYRVVGEPFQKWGTPNYIKPTGNQCVSCHILGPNLSSGCLTKDATGQLTTDNADGQDCKQWVGDSSCKDIESPKCAQPFHFLESVTDEYDKYPNAYWSGHTNDLGLDKDSWSRKWLEDIKQIEGCHVPKLITTSLKGECNLTEFRSMRDITDE